MAVKAIDGVFPAGVRAFYTDRLGGVSQGPFQGYNLGTHVGDVPSRVAYNRALLKGAIGLAEEPRWLNQVHSTAVSCDSQLQATADAATTALPGQALAIMTADCLPVLFATEDGRQVAAAHAGWRGLAAGVLEATLAKMATTSVVAWLGPCIGPTAFEVGAEVKDAFVDQHPEDSQAFAARGDKYLADLQQLAANRLARLGVRHLYREPACTLSEPTRFFSYRRDGQTGRMAFLILRKD
ncbi:peptidoglycan editing factor PgeF [Gallaecimonas xiamenensis]|uniref:Purine nucleoside phosphorylase n=1 Tax=Gallaecimonas xiamenensis 3-C-1 TaxID=745411 RepID=K2JCC8_9GAMM|nr:peptidoglycan editing factor PgeF [Gallaecimonas xiamenensis]EKE68254.1 hypothetical protein B3C1_17142 [Gallaecimonas xiamenensis 3-C-1]